MDSRGGDTHASQAVDLILHEGDKRSYDDAETRAGHYGDLIRKRLPAARRHQSEGVAPLQHGEHDLLLPGAEVLVTPIFIHDGQ